MSQLPTISIVVPSFNQGQFIGETLQSIVDQDYPHIEVIIQDGNSTDNSIAIAENFVRLYPNIFKLYVEKDAGQADALNKGFSRTTGEIMAFLNSDDTYFPRILHRVAAEISPAKGRYVVMGRCIFTGTGSPYVGIEHPAEYINHFEHLAIWKRGFNTIPQPSVFWHRTVWDCCGGLDINEHHVLDYDLFCRFSQYYYFHRIDELFSTYRMHNSSKSSQHSESEVLEFSIQASRKYWKSWLSPLRWKCEFSYWKHNRQWHEYARHYAQRAENAFHYRHYRRALIESIKTFFASPLMARDRLFYAWLIAKWGKFFKWLVASKKEFSDCYSDGCIGLSKEEFTGCYADGWIGPIYHAYISVPKDGKEIIITAKHHISKRITVELFINKKLADSEVIEKESTFSLVGNLEPYCNQTISLELKTDFFFVPSDLKINEDKRKLSVCLENNGKIIIKKKNNA